MAAPATANIKNLDGKWVIESKISDPIDPILSLQGISWLVRRAVTLATVTLHYSSSTSDSGIRQITINQVATGGLKGTTENRTLDWTYRPHSDWLFGDLKGKSRETTLDAIKTENAGSERESNGDLGYLLDGWSEGTKGEGVIESYVENENAGWSGWQVWGFADVDVAGKKERWHVRRFVVRKGKDVQRVRLLYSWAGGLDQ